MYQYIKLICVGLESLTVPHCSVDALRCASSLGCLDQDP